MKPAVSDVVYKGISSRIRDGIYPVGFKIPTEQELCAQFSVGRSSVREATSMLQAHGFIKSKRGSGTYVISKFGNQTDTLNQWMVENQESIADYMDVRHSVESLSLKLFIKSYDVSAYNRLQEIESQFEQAIRNVDVDTIVGMDEALHMAIANATGNQLLIDINNKLIEAFRQYRNITFACDAGYESAIAEHRRVLEAIQRQDTDDALYALRIHLENSYKLTFTSISKA